ncbi:hypothetical protein AOC36_10750 [Erysipelothrix larvae]|uniref:Uncharacterized protein n=1 Tax=Erysipelothrix larvae TaxID=1514105 RepID=A0A0X8H1N5_9FIRM|nr:hypothetical protein [Erysipelothrix larvae]AMC94433.1 hypothetical protein AOC36_10750 [Erysipelothrix larvae]
MTYRNRIVSHKTVEAFFLVQMNQVCVLETNDERVLGVVWDQGNYYSVEYCVKENDYTITKDGITTISPYLTPYASALDFACQNKDASKNFDIMKNKQVFKVILPYILDIQRARNIDELSAYVDDLFERIDLDTTNQDICKLMAYVEFHHVFEMYAEYKVDLREFFCAMMEECMDSIDRILNAQTMSVEMCVSRMLIVNQDQRLAKIISDKSNINTH